LNSRDGLTLPVLASLFESYGQTDMEKPLTGTNRNPPVASLIRGTS
jgi:hypothetical protein